MAQLEVRRLFTGLLRSELHFETSFDCVPITTITKEVMGRAYYDVEVC